MTEITGIHHITSGVGGVQEDVDFFTKGIGQKLIKKTVLFDGSIPIYHLYYANAEAQLGTIMTTLPFGKVGYSGKRGSGQVKTVCYSVPNNSLEFWKEHLVTNGIEVKNISERFGMRSLSFVHPTGLEFEMVEDADDTTRGWVTDYIKDDVAVRGIHSAVLSVRDLEEQERFLSDGLGFKKIGSDGAYVRYHINGGGAQRTIELRHEPDLPQGTWHFAQGVVHHIAFAVPTEKEQHEIKERLVGVGFPDVSEVKDRNYFHSVYVRSPGGILTEFATSDIGFMIDEDMEELGTRTMIPPFWEHRRKELLDALEPIEA